MMEPQPKPGLGQPELAQLQKLHGAQLHAVAL